MLEVLRVIKYETIGSFVTVFLEQKAKTKCKDPRRMLIGCKIFSRWGQFTCPEIQSALPLPRPPLYHASNHKLMIMVYIGAKFLKRRMCIGLRSASTVMGVMECT